MDPHSDYQGHALTILAIATAAIGVGLFRVNFRADDFLLEPGLGPLLAGIKLVLGLTALVSYVLLLASVVGSSKRVGT